MKSPNSTPHVTIVLPYAEADRQTPYWARGENEVDWLRGGMEADRCTVAFAAIELRDHLVRTVPTLKVSFSDTMPKGDPAIVVGPASTIAAQLKLKIAGVPKDPQGYVIRSLPGNRLVLSGGGREGTLYAVYVWLEELGWRWQEPGVAGELAPQPLTELPLSGWRKSSSPAFQLFRGFHAEPKSLESADLFRWMARNRLNMTAWFPQTGALMRKLGFKFISGGHVLETILDPDLPLANGRTLFEEHPDWFAEVNGKRERSQAYRYQCCVTNSGAIRHITSAIVEHFRQDWSETDWQNIWMFDTWSGWCQCRKCQDLGNDSDRYLYFLSKVRAAVDRAVATGRFKRDPGLVLVAYEGTPSLVGPSRGIPENLATGKDFVLHAPINRCYAHTLDDASCDGFNHRYAKTLGEWCRHAKQMPVGMLEYYNVSKFEDLPLLFTRTIGHDIAYYHRLGVRGMSYMHVPVGLWGPRALTQILYARLAWDPKADVSALMADYFERRYENAAGLMHTFYDELETAYANVTAWRNWAEHVTINRRLLAWDGKTRPTESIFVTKHLQPDGGTAIGPKESIKHLERAARALDRARKLSVTTEVRRRIADATRAFRYGDESFRLYWAVARLHDAEWRGLKSEARKIWREVAALAESLDSYYMPFAYDHSAPGVRCKTGLERSQLQGLIDTLRARFETKSRRGR